MSAHAYTEDQLVEQPAIGLFAELGWTTVSALEEIPKAVGSRESWGFRGQGSRENLASRHRQEATLRIGF